MQFVKVVLSIVAALAVVASARQSVGTVDLVRTVNQKTKLWTASLSSPVSRLTREEVRALLGAGPEGFEHPGKYLLRRTYGAAAHAAAPESYDPREAYPNCTSMRMIRDQAWCGSCWAFGAVSAISDRICMREGRDVILSSQDMLACSGAGGCNGGMPYSAYRYWVSTGVVTEACKPYTADSHACDAVCNDTQHSRPAYFFAERAYSVFVPFDHARNVRAIQQEILARGPVEAAFYVLADFRDYAGGVYHRTAGAAFQGGHAIKIVGWGVDAATRMPYWTVANSWGEDWGENGFFRIRRGTNECGIESEIAIGTIKI